MNLKKLYLISTLCLLPQVLIFSAQTTPNHTITVFVHGTFSFRKAVQYSPFRPMIYCKQGLHRAKDLPSYYFFHDIAFHCTQQDPANYNLDQFYIFGWKSEHIYNQTRKKAAKKLVQELDQLVQSYYKKHNAIPHLQLIGFSHGGNVVLHTANYLPLKVNNQRIPLEIWLFGTPVQEVNKNLIESTHFDKSYAIHSSTDWMQRMDPQGLRKLPFDVTHIWSDRMFKPTDRCIQVSLTVNNKPIAHSYYRYIFKYLPKIQKLIKSQEIKSALEPMQVNLII